jgi:hypothetical protein
MSTYVWVKLPTGTWFVVSQQASKALRSTDPAFMRGTLRLLAQPYEQARWRRGEQVRPEAVA